MKAKRIRLSNKSELGIVLALEPEGAVKSSTATQTDSITVQFIVMKNGMITALSSVESDKPGHGDILSAIKKNACVWSPAIMGGRPVFCHKKMAIFYSIDNKGNIQSLDRVEYRYDHH